MILQLKLFTNANSLVANLFFLQSCGLASGDNFCSLFVMVIEGLIYKKNAVMMMLYYSCSKLF